MATDISKVLIGAGVVSIGDYVTAGGAGTLVDVGHTKGPSVITPSYEIYRLDSERLLAVALQKVTLMSLQLKVPMIECTAARLAIAMKQPAANVSGTGDNLTVRVDQATDRQHQVQLVGRGPGTTNTRTITLWKCQVASVEEIPFSKGVEQMYNVLFDVLYDETVATADKFFKQVDS